MRGFFKTIACKLFNHAVREKSEYPNLKHSKKNLTELAKMDL